MREIGNIVVDLSFEFALSIISFSEQLEEKRKFVISKQILRSGTSIGANIREAQNAESKADFIHKLKIAAKEAEEVEYWLLLCQFSDNYPNTESLRVKLISIKKLLSKIIATSKKSN
ncbi:MAG: four helix bundle protein [Bacteroidales bacterium]|nr:four helix bundle protein [Bacteroidales bacterium]